MNNGQDPRNKPAESRPKSTGPSNFPQFNTARRDAQAATRRPQPQQPKPVPRPAQSPERRTPSELPPKKATPAPSPAPAPKAKKPRKVKEKKTSPKKSRQPERQVSPERLEAEEIRRRRILEEQEHLNEAKKRIAEAKAKKKAQKRAEFREKYGSVFKDSMGYFALFICCLLIICCVTATVFLISMLGTTEKPELPETVTLYAGGEKSKYPYSYAYEDGIYFVNFSKLAEFCALSASGDDDNIVYSIGGETIAFDIPSRYAFVNQNRVLLSAESRKHGGELWIPIDFVREYFIGIDITIDDTPTEKGTPQVSITVSRIKLEDSDKFVDISFLLKANDTLGGISDSSLPDEPITLPDDVPQYDFIKDLSAYYVYMSPADRDKYLVLINGSNQVDETYIPEDLIKVINSRPDRELTLCRDAAKSLEALFIEMYAAGYLDVSVTLAYRSYEAQKRQYDIYLFNERYHNQYFFEENGKPFSDTAYKILGEKYLQTNYINKGKTVLTYEDGVKVTSSYSAFPGTGDHQTGLSCDLYSYGFSGTKFAETEAYSWLLENAHKFGFIFRFPEGKEKFTGCDFEPAHLRFVGQYHAAVMNETGLCLEEYLAKLSARPDSGGEQ